MPRPKKQAKSNHKAEFITKEDFVRLTHEVEATFNKRHKQDQKDEFLRRHQVRIFWAFFSLIALLSLLQGIHKWGFHFDGVSFNCLIGLLILPMFPSASKGVIALLQQSFKLRSVFDPSVKPKL